MKPITTSWGRVIPSRVLEEIRSDIMDGVDWQRTITDHLRDLIPEHEEDQDEAMEVYNQVEDDLFFCEHLNN
jgi:hypothetical protein